MQNLNNFISQNIAVIFISLLVIFVVMTVFLFFTALGYKKVARRYKTLMRGMGEHNLEEVMFEYLSKVEIATNKVNELELQNKKLKKVADKSLQNVGIVRFNAFENTGSDLSFAIALLDAYKDGVILSSLFSRHESRIYAKPVKNGVSNYNLSDEEQEALDEALKY